MTSLARARPPLATKTVPQPASGDTDTPAPWPEAGRRTRRVPERTHRATRRRPRRARPLARGSPRSRVVRPERRSLRHLGRVGEPARRRPGRLAGQPGAPFRRPGRFVARLARARARRDGHPPPHRPGRPTGAEPAPRPRRRRRRRPAGGRCARPTSPPSAPETDRWLVAGRSDTREDLVEVRRLLRSRGAAGTRRRERGRWCSPSPPTGSRSTRRSTSASVLHADVHRYPGSAQRALVGDVHEVAGAGAAASAAAVATTVAGACCRDRPRPRRRAVARPRPGHADRHAHRSAMAAGCSATTPARSPSLPRRPSVATRRRAARGVGRRARDAHRRVDRLRGRATHGVPRRPHARHRTPRRPVLRERRMSDATDTWNELVTVGLLGTDRRERARRCPTDPLPTSSPTPCRPRRRHDFSRRCRRWSSPGAAARGRSRARAPLMAPPQDPRPMLPVAAARRWHAIVVELAGPRAGVAGGRDRLRLEAVS